MPVEHRPDFKQALSTLQQMKQRVLLLHGGVGKVLGGFLIPMKVTMEMNQVLIEQGDLLYKYVEQTILQGMIFLNSFTFFTDGSFTVDGGPL